MSKAATVAKGLVILFASVLVLLPPFFLLPPLAVALARWDDEPSTDQWGQGLTIRGDVPSWLRWLQTTDERLPGGTYEPTVAAMLSKRGRFLTSWYWIGLRNRAHGLRRVFGIPSTEAAYSTRFMPDDKGRVYGVRPDGSWYWQRSILGLRVVAGHRVYRLLDGSYLAVPTATIKKA